MQVVIDYHYWINSQMSVARHFGGICINGKTYIIHKRTLDLVREDWMKVYKRAGAEETLRLAVECRNATEALRVWKERKAAELEAKMEAKQMELFNDGDGDHGKE